eukprot:COSAG05_NODE_1610_length_4408_cov_4.339290_5_plen_113_part_00
MLFAIRQYHDATSSTHLSLVCVNILALYCRFGNVGGSTMQPRAITVTRSLKLTAAQRWEFNFTDAFVFPTQPIQDVQCVRPYHYHSAAAHAASLPRRLAICYMSALIVATAG